jgi:hypothetical protein
MKPLTSLRIVSGPDCWSVAILSLALIGFLPGVVSAVVAARIIRSRSVRSALSSQQGLLG